MYEVWSVFETSTGSLFEYINIEVSIMVCFSSFSGIVTEINDFIIQSGENVGCNQLISVSDGLGNIVNFVVSPDTYFTDQVLVGDYITGYYDKNVPVILIYPPQYTALIVTQYDPNENIKVDYFDSQLVSSDGQLKLNIAPYTQIILKNGQPFNADPANRNLIVFYGASTRSVPAQTTPTEIIVWCS